MKYGRVLVCCLALAMLVIPAESFAAKALSVDIYGPGQKKINIVFADPLGLGLDNRAPQEAGEFLDNMRANLGLLPFLNLMPSGEILGGTMLEGVDGVSMDYRRFSVSKADLVMTLGWRPRPGGPAGVECRVFDVFSQRLVVGKAYSNVSRDNLAQVADMFSAALMEALTGRGDFFRSRLAFTRTEQNNVREIWISGPQGRNPQRVTRLGGSSISPSWSRDGRYIAFAHHSSNTHTLGMWDSSDNRVFRVNLPGTTISGTAFTPDNRIVVALSRGNMEIFMLTKDLTRIAQTVVQSWAIDVSPSFDAEGKKMAFTSDRHGNPHIYIKDMETNEIRRVTYEGKYNTSPSLSGDGDLVAFSRRTPEGHRIFVHNLNTGRERQVSFGPGNDEEPAFSPDGYFIVFASNRTGQYKLYLTTIHGAEPKMIAVGDGSITHPSFGPLRDQ